MKNEKNILKRFINKSGIIFCIIYLLIILLCFFMAFNSGGDFKGSSLFMQLPIALQLALLINLLDVIGLEEILVDLLRNSPYVSYLIYFTIVTSTFIYLMLVGKALQVIKEKLIKWNEY